MHLQYPELPDILPSRSDANHQHYHGVTIGKGYLWLDKNEAPYNI